MPWVLLQQQAHRQHFRSGAHNNNADRNAYQQQLVQHVQSACDVRLACADLPQQSSATPLGSNSAAGFRLAHAAGNSRHVQAHTPAAAEPDSLSLKYDDFLGTCTAQGPSSAKLSHKNESNSWGSPNVQRGTAELDRIRTSTLRATTITGSLTNTLQVSGEIAPCRSLSASSGNSETSIRCSASDLSSPATRGGDADAFATSEGAEQDLFPSGQNVVQWSALLSRPQR